MKSSRLLPLFLVPSLVWGQAASPPGFEAFDTPNDGGGSITVTWPLDETAPGDAVYNIYVAELATGPFHPARLSLPPAPACSRRIARSSASAPRPRGTSSLMSRSTKSTARR